MKYYKIITAEILKCDINKLDEIQSFVGKEYYVRADEGTIDIETNYDAVTQGRDLTFHKIVENGEYLIKYHDNSIGWTDSIGIKKWTPILNLPSKKAVIDKSKWNRALDGILPENDQEVFYWFEYAGLHQGKYERTYCEELNAYLNVFYSPMGFLSDEDVYWLPKDALPFEFIYEEEK